MVSPSFKLGVTGKVVTVKDAGFKVDWLEKKLD